MPTLLAAAGVDVPHTTGPLDGVNILPLLTGGRLPSRTLFWHFPNYTNQGSKPAGAVREGDLKLVLNDETGRPELYNLAADAGEKNDRAPSEAARTTELMANWRRGEIGRRPGGNAERGVRRGLS